MAGAPGAGKTEFILSVIDREKYIIIDLDHYRTLFEGYTGANASDFQRSSTRVANKMYKFCMKHNLNVVMDGTLSSVSLARQNLAQCITNKRDVSIVLVYQDPVISYLYTKLREFDNTRNVPDEAFIEKYFKSVQNAFEIVGEFSFINFLIAHKHSNGDIVPYEDMRDREKFDKIVKFNYNSGELLVRLKDLDITKHIQTLHKT